MAELQANAMFSMEGRDVVITGGGTSKQFDKSGSQSLILDDIQQLVGWVR